MTPLDELLHKEAIRDVLATYARGLDFQDWAAVARSFTRDGVYDMHDYFARLGLDVEPARGRDAIVAGLQAAMASGGTQIQHFFTNVVIRIEDKQAEAESYLLVHTSRADGSFLTGAVWQDKLTNTADGWQVAYRYLKFVWAEGAADVVLDRVRASVKADA